MMKKSNFQGIVKSRRRWILFFTFSRLKLLGGGMARREAASRIYPAKIGEREKC
jgi:hypothetical protein